MEALIKQVVELERRAKDVIQAARDRQASIEAEIERAKAEIESNLNKKMNKKLEQIRSMEMNEGRDKIEIIKTETEKKLAEIKQRYLQNRVSWEEELFKKIIGR